MFDDKNDDKYDAEDNRTNGQDPAITLLIGVGMALAVFAALAMMMVV